MRAATVIITLIASALIGTTPVSSLSSLRSVTPHLCAPQATRAISLVGSGGEFGIVAFSPLPCSQ